MNTCHIPHQRWSC